MNAIGAYGSVKTCPKCGGEPMSRPLYCAGALAGCNHGPNLVGLDEHMRRFCGTCMYGWSEGLPVLTNAVYAAKL